jgi:sugar phosphate isomerase/epimerase
MIRLGTVLMNFGHATADRIHALLPHGFESFQIGFKNSLNGTDLARLADETAAVLDGRDAVVSCLGVYGNTLAADDHGDEVRATIRDLIALAPRFGTDLVCCFAGRVTGASIPDSIPRFRDIFCDLADFAGSRGVRLAIENCLQGGTWKSGDRNIAHNPDAWELMFQAVPSPALGLEWEPAHQLCQLIDPLPQLRTWAPRVFHVHGKDGEVRHDLIATHGFNGAHRVVHHRFPGLGDSNWKRIVSTLVGAGYRGTIDIEGGHDPVYRGELEMTGQLFGLKHLEACRAAFVANPETPAG